MRTIASPKLLVVRCPSILKSGKSMAVAGARVRGTPNTQKPDSTSRFIASVSSASMTTRGVTLISLKFRSILRPEIAALGIEKKGNVNQVVGLVASRYGGHEPAAVRASESAVLLQKAA